MAGLQAGEASHKESGRVKCCERGPFCWVWKRTVPRTSAGRWGSGVEGVAEVLEGSSSTFRGLTSVCALRCRGAHSPPKVSLRHVDYFELKQGLEDSGRASDLPPK